MRQGVDTYGVDSKWPWWPCAVDIDRTDNPAGDICTVSTRGAERAFSASFQFFKMAECTHTRFCLGYLTNINASFVTVLSLDIIFSVQTMFQRNYTCDM